MSRSTIVPKPNLIAANLASRDISIVISGNDRTPVQHTKNTCDDAACDDACYQKGGFTGGSCDADGVCQCTDPPPPEQGKLGNLKVQGEVTFPPPPLTVFLKHMEKAD